MIDLTHLTLYLAAALLLAITPGPGIFYVAARTLAGGWAEGIAMVAEMQAGRELTRSQHGLQRTGLATTCSAFPMAARAMATRSVAASLVDGRIS
ncbi:Probable amino acid efflux protein (plasmid) [Mesorhizobium loti]|nr:Probable amino acid efflux protein [Mesorhizobium loti]